MHSDTRSVKQRILDIIAEYTSAPLTDKAKLRQDLRMDDADVRGLCEDIELAFNVMFDEDEEDFNVGPMYTSWDTVADVVRTVYDFTGKK